MSEKFRKTVNRASAHAAYQVGQIASPAKRLRGANWRTSSVPKNKPAEFSRYRAEKKDKGNYPDAPRKFGREKIK